MREALNVIDKHVGNRVRMRRLMLDMSQTALADGLGISFQQVQKYEKGTNRISASRLQQIADVLEVPVPFFFEELPAQTTAQEREATSVSPTMVNDFLATAEGLELCRSFTRIKDRKRRSAIVDLVELLAGAHY